MPRVPDGNLAHSWPRRSANATRAVPEHLVAPGRCATQMAQLHPQPIQENESCLRAATTTNSVYQIRPARALVGAPENQATPPRKASGHRDADRIGVPVRRTEMRDAFVHGSSPWTLDEATGQETGHASHLLRRLGFRHLPPCPIGSWLRKKRKITRFPLASLERSTIQLYVCRRATK